VMTRQARQRASDARASTGHGNGDALIAPGRAAGALLGLLGLLVLGWSAIAGSGQAAFEPGHGLSG
jgi:hypothetical protein